MGTARQLSLFMRQENKEGLEHIQKIHSAGKQSAWITLASKHEKFRQYHYKVQELTAEKVGAWGTIDTYYSQNKFYAPYRRIEFLTELDALYIDIDPKKHTPEQIVMELQEDYFGVIIPYASEIVFSGIGIHLKWYLNPVPAKALPLWTAIQRYLHEQLKHFGSDPVAIDPTRILRLAGTINSKNGKKVEVLYNDALERYELRDIQREYLPELPDDWREKKAQRQEQKHKSNKKRKGISTITRLFKEHSLYHARLLDLVKLIELRGYDLFFKDAVPGEARGCHEVVLFLYRYWSCCFEKDTEKALLDTLDINLMFKYPMPEKRVIQATRSAEKMYLKQNDEATIKLAQDRGYPSAGYRYSNERLIELLQITEEEQQHLSTIISRKVKQSRNTESKREKRREEGMKARQEYLAEQKEKSEDILWQLEQAMKRHPKAKGKELAEMLGVTPARISQLKKKLKN